MSSSGCEERGYNCYICSSIFTLPSGLHQHMLEHGSSYRPYDCSQCSKKFFFRAELDNHLIDHENGRIGVANHDGAADAKTNPLNRLTSNYNPSKLLQRDDGEMERVEIKSEAQKSTADEDDEYIEVEQIGEGNGVEAMENGDVDVDGKQPDQPKSYHNHNENDDDENTNESTACTADCL